MGVHVRVLVMRRIALVVHAWWSLGLRLDRGGARRLALDVPLQTGRLLQSGHPSQQTVTMLQSSMPLSFHTGLTGAPDWQTRRGLQVYG